MIVSGYSIYTGKLFGQTEQHLIKDYYYGTWGT